MQAVVICAWSRDSPAGQGSAASAVIAPSTCVRQRAIHSGDVHLLGGTAVKLVPPKGAEFGKTEVFYLNVQAESRSRATTLAAAICKQLQARSQELRDQKAKSLIAELTKTVDLAQVDLSTTTAELTNIETRVGADLGELRVLNEVGGGDSPLCAVQSQCLSVGDVGSFSDTLEARGRQNRSANEIEFHFRFSFFFCRPVAAI
jgi:hypothetical protein